MKTAILAAAFATFMSTQAFAGEAKPSKAGASDCIDGAAVCITGNQHAERQVLELQPLPELPHLSGKGDDCAIAPTALACDKTAYEAADRKVNDWFVKNVLDKTASAPEYVAKHPHAPGSTGSFLFP